MLVKATPSLQTAQTALKYTWISCNNKTRISFCTWNIPFIRMYTRSYFLFHFPPFEIHFFSRVPMDCRRCSAIFHSWEMDRPI